MKIILIGKMGAGKNTVADYLTNKYNFTQFAFADKLKEIARELFPDAFKEGKPRKLLQDLGVKMREIKKDCWTNYVIRKAEKVYGNVVITDCRYKNELEIARKNGFTPVRIISDEETRLARLVLRDGTVDKSTFSHPSEVELDNVEVKYKIINNYNLEELYKQIDALIKIEALIKNLVLEILEVQK